MLENLLDYLRDAPTVPVVSLGVLLVIWYFTPKWNDKRPPCPWTRLPIIGNLIRKLMGRSYKQIKCHMKAV